MDEISRSHLRLNNYYRIQNHLAKLIDLFKLGVNDFCDLCFEPTCEHQTGRDNYENAIGQLKFWQEVALAEARPVLVHPEHPVPSWVSLFRGEGSPREGSHYYFPFVDNIQLVQVKRYQTILLPQDKHLGRMSAKTGYYYYHRGNLVCRFSDGFFEPNISIMDETIPGNGEWFAFPKSGDYLSFAKAGIWKIIS